jgi:hypothetical protein
LRGLEIDRFTNAIRLFLSSGGRRKRKAEAYVVVAIVRGVVVAIGHTAIPRVIVPTAAANYAIGAPQPTSIFNPAHPLIL